MTKGDRVALTPEAVRIFPDIGTREGVLIGHNAQVVIVRWTGWQTQSYLRRELIMPVARGDAP